MEQIRLNIDGAPSFQEMLNRIDAKHPVIGKWSGGITSAVTCRLCIDWFGKENVRLVFIDTKNEDPDTYRFKEDCERWYRMDIESIDSEKFNSIQDVWRHYLSLNVATGAICSTELKREVGQEFTRNNQFSYQAFGYDINETDRAIAMQANYPDIHPIFPLVYSLLSKKQCGKIIQQAGIRLPVTYDLGFLNNNCFQTGCVQGGIGYWQKMQRDQPDKFDAMAAMEHELTDKKGEPVTMLKDQSKGGGLVFLKPHPKYPQLKDISMMKGREPKPLFECNGFCSTNDLNKNKTESEINFA